MNFQFLTWTGYQSISKEIVQQFVEENFFGVFFGREYRLQILRVGNSEEREN